MLIYTHKISLRCKYIFNLFFKDLYGIDYTLTTDWEEYVNHKGTKFSYCTHNPQAGFHIQSVPIIHEQGVKEQNISIGEWRGYKILFKTDPSLEIPFDIFSAAFYLVTRYEEYLPHLRDKYDRYEAESSIAYQHDFLEMPIINYWAIELKEILKSRFPELKFREDTYRYISTIDIDNAYAF